MRRRGKRIELDLVWRVLEREHRGAARAISQERLAGTLGISVRVLQDAIQHLRQDFSRPIVP